MAVLRGLLAAFFLMIPIALITIWVSSAETRLAEAQAEPPENEVAVASAANEGYCSGGLKKVLRRVLQSCGLLDSGTVRGCQPADAKTVATMSGSDFNALFRPMKHRGGIVQFEKGEAVLDVAATEMVDGVFADQKGASYFFVVSRSSPDGSTEFNRKLSKERAEAVMTRLREKFNDPDLDKQVGLLWLGEEFAQLEEEFCTWERSREGKCDQTELNRSAFVAWIDCTL